MIDITVGTQLVAPVISPRKINPTVLRKGPMNMNINGGQEIIKPFKYQIRVTMAEISLIFLGLCVRFGVKMEGISQEIIAINNSQTVQII